MWLNQTVARYTLILITQEDNCKYDEANVKQGSPSRGTDKFPLQKPSPAVQTERRNNLRAVSTQ